MPYEWSPPSEELAKFTRMVVEEMHTEWDTLHQFLILTSKDGVIVPRVIGMIDPALHPDSYPEMLMKMAKEDIEGMGDDDPAPIAYLLQIEAFGVKLKPPEEMTERDKWEFDRDRHFRTFHTRPEAIEVCMATCVDVTGRIYQSTKYRDDGSIVDEEIPPLGTDSEVRQGGQMTKVLRACAYATGMMCWNLPGPPVLQALLDDDG